jgi:hypothetical protein
MSSERLIGEVDVKASLLQAHLDWARRQLSAQTLDLIPERVPEEYAVWARGHFLSSQWIPFAALVHIDRAIADFAGGDREETYLALGRHSARLHLRGAYRGFVRTLPHEFFESCAALHGQFQGFGHARYERSGAQSGRLYVEDYDEYSPVFCASGRGYYLGALEVMGAPRDARVVETLCQCSGDPACLFDASW